MHSALTQDQTLVEASLEGNADAFQVLVERYQRRLFAFVRHYTRNPVEVEDIVQDTFLKAYSRLDSFQQNATFSTWLYRIATNTVLDFLKRRGRSPIQAVEDPEVTAATEGSESHGLGRPDSGMDQDEIAEVTHKVLDELPEIFRTVLVLREFEERAYQEIADILGISIGTVESRLFRARARFKQKLTQMYPEFSVPDAS